MIGAIYERFRLVSPLPPHAPEPYPDEPFAPVYDHVPLTAVAHAALPMPRWPDPLVFGPEYPRWGVAEPSVAARCGPCDVTWAYGAGRACWCCGRPG